VSSVSTDAAFSTAQANLTGRQTAAQTGARGEAGSENFFFFLLLVSVFEGLASTLHLFRDQTLFVPSK
jgi:hypothetical protein